MKLQFESDLDYQQDAVAAVVDLFAGQEVGQSLFTVARPRRRKSGEVDISLPFDDVDPEGTGVANALRLPPEELLGNLRNVQLRNGLRQDDRIDAMDFAVEMETGTGKTYVYLRTALELNRRYGWTKFVIVVPSVAIKQGVLKTLQMTHQHFRSLYDGVPIESQEYDSGDLSRVRDFATSRNVRFLVTTVQAIYPDKNRVAYQPHEKTGGDRPIDLIRGTNPVVIVDEPQSVEGGEDGVGAEAIRGLHPLAILRYSATHLKKVHEVYRLDAVDAFSRRLVKRIEVASAVSEAMFNKPFVRLVKVQTRKGTGPRATLELDVATSGGGVNRKEVVLTGNEDLQQTTRRDVYRDVRLGEVRGGKAAEQMVELRLPGETKWLRRGETHGGIDPDQFDRELIDKAITKHLDKELSLRPDGIKVLTLFFIDTVADYRQYDEDGSSVPGRLARMFEAIYERKKNDPKYKTLFGSIEKELPAAEVHDGYFAKDSQGRIKDTRDTKASVNSRDAKDAFDLIMKDKERLLSLGEPLKFIFSHSALREGWDNPNVFQVCSLRAMSSERQRRQTLGRGLRICVGSDGNRNRDPDVNVLTVIAGESYADFAARLQTEYEDEGVVFGRVERHDFARLEDDGGQIIGQDVSDRLHDALQESGYLDSRGHITDALRTAIRDGNVQIPEGFAANAAEILALLKDRAGRRIDVSDAAEKVTVRPQRSVIDSEAFAELWRRVRDRTTYRVAFDSHRLIDACVRTLERLDPVDRARMRWTIGDIRVARSGVETSDDVATDTRYLDEVGAAIPDVLGLLQERTGLTRATVAAVLNRSGRTAELRTNPQAVIKLVGDVIENEKQMAMVDGIRYERTDTVWAQTLFDREFERDLKTLMEGGSKSTTDYVPVDGSVERTFLKDLIAEESVKLFAKLPREFKVPTPLGNYEPDWAVLVDVAGEDRLYLVVETKGDLLPSARRSRENAKIDCGKAHFKAVAKTHEAPAEYRVAMTLASAMRPTFGH